MKRWMALLVAAIVGVVLLMAQPVTAGNECGNAPSSYLHVGDIGYVADVDGTGNRLREQPSTSGRIITTVQVYGALSVDGGPECHDGYRWWQVQTPNESGTGMITGWMADGSGSERWIEVGNLGEGFEGGNGNVVSPTPDSQIMDFDWYYQPFDHIYHIEFDSSSCLITNGSEMVGAEIERFSFWTSNIRSARLRDIAVAPYFLPRIGEIDAFRRYLARNLGEASGGSCYVSDDGNEADIWYQVGSHSMDMSGLGNIVFGFYMERYNRTLENITSAIAQAANPDSPFQFSDNPDDVSQRATGRSLAEAIGDRASPTIATIERAADENDLH